jgi:hypothetical protein
LARASRTSLRHIFIPTAAITQAARKSATIIDVVPSSTIADHGIPGWDIFFDNSAYPEPLALLARSILRAAAQTPRQPVSWRVRFPTTSSDTRWFLSTLIEDLSACSCR